MEEKKKETRIALPGEVLGTEEEFLPGEGTTTDSEGNIRAVVAGKVNINENRQIDIFSNDILQKVKVGDVVYGMVEEMFETVAFVIMEHKASNSTKRMTHASAIIPVSEIQEGYVECMRDAVHVGDFVKAVVSELTPFRVVLSLKPKGMGVVQGFCSYDRHPMDLKGGVLVCSNCGQREARKLGEPYGEYKFAGKIDSSLLKRERSERRGPRPGGFRDRGPRSDRGGRGSGGGDRGRFRSERGPRREGGFRREGQGGGRPFQQKRGRSGGQSKF